MIRGVVAPPQSKKTQRIIRIFTFLYLRALSGYEFKTLAMKMSQPA
jgi:hypothetical protein